MRYVLAGITAIVLLASSTPARADTTTPAMTPPPTGRVTAELVVVNGSGCGTAPPTVEILPDNSTVRITYRGPYVAKVGAGARLVDARRNCQVSLRIHAPSEYTWAIDRIEHEGLVHLQPGATAFFRHNHYMAGLPTRPSVTHQFRGPVTDHWHTTDAYPDEELVYALCGIRGLLNITTEIRAVLGTSDPATASFISIGDLDGGESTYRLAWRLC